MNRRQISLIGGLIGLILSSSVSAERVEWKSSDGGNGHFYEAVASEDPVAIADAQAAAKDAGGHLATIGSEKENDFVFKLVDNEKFWGADDYNNAFGPWLGGEQDAKATEADEGWQWSTGEEFDYTNWSSGAGEPNDSDAAEDHTEDFITFFSFGSTSRVNEWNDSNGNSQSVFAYVIEWTPKEELDAAKAKAAEAAKASDAAPAGEADDDAADTSAESSETDDAN